MCVKNLMYGAIACFFLTGAASVAAAAPKAVIGAVAADWSAYAHSVVDVDPVGGPRQGQHQLQPTGTNFVLAAYGEYFYRIERMNADNIAKFSVNAPATPIWQYSTLDRGDLVSGNPGGMTFVSATKAYLFRYEKQTAWIVNPSADSEAAFKIGELNLAAYGDQDGFPEMQAGVIVDGKLFVILQRLDRNNEWTPNTAYVAVFDAQTDREIDTGQPNADGVKGIPLPVKNPLAIQYLEANHTIYIQAVGKYGASWSGLPPMYDGGVAALNPATYNVSLIIDDGDDAVHPYGLISGMVVASPTKGYFVGYDGWLDNTLYPFNPTDGSVGTPLPGFQNTGIAGMDSGLCLDKNGMVWVSNQTQARVDILNPTTDAIDESINIGMNPFVVVFASEGAAAGPEDDDDGGGSSNCFIDSLKLTP